MKNLPLQTSIKRHAIIGANLGLWLVAFLVLIAPFDIAELSLKSRLILLPIYGLVVFAAYMLLIPLQNWVFKRTNVWRLFSEICFIIVFNLLIFIGSYTYYQSDLVNGNYNFSLFAMGVFLPVLIIFIPILVVGRWYVFKQPKVRKEASIILKGENKLDILKLNPSDLICISSATNYVEVSYLKNSTLQRKLLRSTLKTMEDETSGLLKVHRSHLINPLHFKEWKDANTIILNQMEVPVSKKYKPSVLELK